MQQKWLQSKVAAKPAADKNNYQIILLIYFILYWECQWSKLKRGLRGGERAAVSVQETCWLCWEIAGCIVWSLERHLVWLYRRRRRRHHQRRRRGRSQRRRHHRCHSHHCLAQLRSLSRYSVPRGFIYFDNSSQKFTIDIYYLLWHDTISLWVGLI